MNIKNILRSGFGFSDDEYELKLKYILFNSLLIFNITLVSLATFVRLSHEQYFHATVDIVYVILGLSTFIAARYSKLYFKKLVYFVIFFSYLVITLSSYAGLNPLVGLSWWFILLMVTFFLKGSKEGIVIFVISLITIIFISIKVHHHTSIEIALGSIPFFGALFFMYFFEQLNKKLKSTIEQQKEFYHHQSQYDNLTGIPNRELFLDRVSQSTKLAKRSGTKVAILFIDLDHFKEINDSYGHHVGDLVLQEVASRLKSQIRVSDTVARLGGDEFAIILDNFTEISVVENIVHKLFDAMKESFDFEGYHLVFSLSLGITIFPEDSSDVAVLLKNADKAMYQAKNDGRNTYCYYSEELYLKKPTVISSSK